MSLKIRLRQQGRRNQIVYRLVLSDTRSPRDGKYLEVLGWYNPFEEEAEKNLRVHADRISYWLGLGAMLTEKAAALINRGAPEVIQSYRQKQLEARSKKCEKRKAAPKKKEAAATA